MSSNESLRQRSLNSVWHPCTQMKQHESLPLVTISRAEGVWLYDGDGRRYLDAIGSWWVNLFGHANPRINAAIREQLGRLEQNRFVSLQNDYHGETLGALSVTDVALFRETYAPLLRPASHVPTPDWRYASGGESPQEHAL